LTGAENDAVDDDLGSRPAELLIPDPEGVGELVDEHAHLRVGRQAGVDDDPAAFGSHQPPALPLIASNATWKSISAAKACRRSIRWAWLSPVSGSHGGSIGTGSTPVSGSVCESANTNAERNTTRASSVSSPSSLRRLSGIGASTTSPFSPLRTQRPSFSQVRNPATRLGTHGRVRTSAVRPAGGDPTDSCVRARAVKTTAAALAIRRLRKRRP
jgi:hypothetical protein